MTTVATRKRGLDHLLNQVDDVLRTETPPQPSSLWREPSAADVRALYRETERILKACVKPPRHPDTWTGRFDRVLLHPVWGLLILFVVLFTMFQAVSWVKPLQDLMTAGFDWVSAQITTHMAQSWLRSLLTDGIISGVGSVIVFVPQIMSLFLFIIVLEDLGYMARAAFLMDKLMGGAGLHGRAFIPLLSSFACAIPGIMSTRVIDDRRDRLTTILVAPLMTCSARIPVYTLIIYAFIPAHMLWGFVSEQGLVMFGLYAAGIISALLVAFVIRKVFWRGASEPFLMQLPAYKTPDPLNVARGVLLRGQIFLKRAGTTILSMMLIVWALSSVPLAPKGAAGPAIDYRFRRHDRPCAAADLPRRSGSPGRWRVALIPGLAAREVAVGALGTVYAVGNGGENTGALSGVLAHHWSLATALAFLAWYVFAPQCMATLAVVKRETNSWRWPAIMFAYMISLAYFAAFVVYHAAHALGA